VAVFEVWRLFGTIIIRKLKYSITIVSFCELSLKIFNIFVVLFLSVYYKQPSYPRVLFSVIKSKLSHLHTVFERGNKKESQKFVMVKISPVFKTKIYFSLMNWKLNWAGYGNFKSYINTRYQVKQTLQFLISVFKWYYPLSTMHDGSQVHFYFIFPDTYYHCFSPFAVNTYKITVVIFKLFLVTESVRK
jgi:hypothetical protein